MNQKNSSQGTLLLTVLFLLGFLFNVLVIVDAHWTGWFIAPPPHALATEGEPAELDRLKESILLVVVPSCDGTVVKTGTAFVVKEGYLATAAHVVGDHLACGSSIKLLDSFEDEHEAELTGYSDTEDLALLRIRDVSIPPLVLADSSLYEETSELTPIVTIGYPLVGAASKDGEPASVSGEGNLSRYDVETGLFTTSGLNTNPGNSGGPVLLSQTWEVVGIVSSKLDEEVGEAIGFTIPINSFKTFFEANSGQGL